MTNLIAVSDARANLPSLIDLIYKTDDRILITKSGKPRVVMVSIDELESLEETAEILAIPGAKKSILEGEKEIKSGKHIPLSKLK